MGIRRSDQSIANYSLIHRLNENDPSICMLANHRSICQPKRNIQVPQERF